MIDVRAALRKDYRQARDEAWKAEKRAQEAEDRRADKAEPYWRVNVEALRIQAIAARKKATKARSHWLGN